MKKQFCLMVILTLQVWLVTAQKITPDADPGAAGFSTERLQGLTMQ